MSRLTDKELDEARAKTAWEAYLPKVTRLGGAIVPIQWDDCQHEVRQALILAARLAREGWTPHPDPDVLLAREVIANRPCKPETRDMVLAGELDDYEAVQIAVDAIKAARAEWGV